MTTPDSTYEWRNFGEHVTAIAIVGTVCQRSQTIDICLDEVSTNPKWGSDLGCHLYELTHSGERRP